MALLKKKKDLKPYAEYRVAKEDIKIQNVKIHINSKFKASDLKSLFLENMKRNKILFKIK